MTINLAFEGMLDEEDSNYDHPHDETTPGGYLPLNRGFREHLIEWYEDGNPVEDGLPLLDATTTPTSLDLFEDYERSDTLREKGERKGDIVIY